MVLSNKIDEKIANDLSHTLSQYNELQSININLNRF
jgi:hypothetical protein